MKDWKSGLDAWHYITAPESERRSVTRYLPLVLSVAGVLGVSPFMVQRYLQGQWNAAIIDTVIVIGFLALGIYIYRTHRIKVASIAISCLCLAGVLTTVYVIGPQQVYWIYPALMAVFYLVGPRLSIVLSLLTLAALVPRLVGNVEPHTLTTVLITIVVMSLFAFAFSYITHHQREQLLQLATKDPLTGAGNRRSLDAKLAAVMNHQRRNGVAASMLLMDLDHFKNVNDVHGHAMGDQILRRLTEIVNLRIRVTDSLYRIGGEEFVVVLEGQDAGHATHVAEQLRTLVLENELAPDGSVTISIGVAELMANESVQDWMHRADEALYKAKHAGRNATSVAA